MSKNISIYFKCQGRMYSLMLKTSVEEITLSMVESRIYKKLALDESKVKLELSYIPLLVGCEEQFTISDDEDMCVYLTSIDKENRRCILYVEVITISKLPEQLSRADKSSFGMNYDEVHPNDEIRPNVITFSVDNEQAKQHEVIEEEDDDTKRHECVDNDIGKLDMVDEYVEVPPFAETGEFIEAWEDGLDLCVRQEFPNRKAIQELLDRVAFANSFGYVVNKSDTTRWLVKCSIPNCKWGIRATRIPETDIFSIRRYTKMHTCSRASQSTRTLKRRVSAQLVASLLNEDYPGQVETPSPKSIMDLVEKKFGAKISYSTALRGKKQAVRDLRGGPSSSSCL